MMVKRRYCIYTLIERSNLSVLKISFLENYAFFTNEISLQSTSTSTRTILDPFVMLIPEKACSPPYLTGWDEFRLLPALKKMLSDRLELSISVYI